MYIFTADIHLFHNNIIKYERQEFLNKEELEFVIANKDDRDALRQFHLSQETIDRHTAFVYDTLNSYLKPKDTLICNGDSVWTRDYEIVAQFVKNLNCAHVQFILGNHDDKKNKKAYRFQDVLEKIHNFKYMGQEIVASPYPIARWEKRKYGVWHVYGHVHGKYIQGGKSKDVGLYHNRKPISFDELKVEMDAKPIWD